jgi:arsenate reductase
MSSSIISKQALLQKLQATVQSLESKFSGIPSERKLILQELADFIQVRINSGKPVYLNFICTHNSRRSHIAQIWAQAAAHYYNVKGVECFSGGTEATAFNPRAVKAMQNAGFDITIWSRGEHGENPVYQVSFADGAKPLRAFSKKYDDPFNHSTDFAAVMTCSHADENCPLILGASARIALTFDDPKAFDDTSVEAAKYEERVNQIGTEILYAFSRISGSH